MKKTIFLLLALSLSFAWVWAAGELTDKSVSSDDQNTKWQPVYGEKGELLNGQPAVMPFGRTVSGNGNPVITEIQDILLFEDFELPDSWNGSNPPAGWAVIDSGYNPPAWNTYDWYRYASWGGYTARVYGGSSSNANDDWIISPGIDFSSATACSLFFRHWYDDYSTQDVDSALVMLSDDGGSTWPETLYTYFGVDYGTSTVPDSVYTDISSFAAGKANVSVAFQYIKRAFVFCGAWRIDDVTFSADGTPLMTEDFESAWGIYGDQPPAGWTIIDNVIPDPWNNNDWAQYSLTAWGNFARVYYSPSENQNEWLISPAMDLSLGADQILLTFKQFYNDGAGEDTAWVLGSTDGGATWPHTLVMYDTDQGTSAAPDYASLDMTSWANNEANVKIAFKYVGINDFYWYVDSVQVETFDLPSDDVMTEAINSPTIGISGYNHDVSIQVYNSGTDPATFEDSTYIEKLNKATLFFENFSNPQGWTGANPPVNVAGTWAVIDSGSLNDGWNGNDWAGYYYTLWSDTVARVYWSPVEDQIEWLITPIIDLSSNINTRLTFKTFYDDYSGTTDTAWVLGTTDGWVTTHELAMWTDTDYGSSSAPEYPIFDISSWADGSSSVQIGFRYVGNNDMPWYVDNVEVYQALPSTTYYVSGETVTSLVSLESRTVPYADTWNNPTVGIYEISSFTNLATDADFSNDSLAASLIVYEHYESGGPDAGDYSWNSDKDGGTGDPYSWIDISSIGTPVTWDLGSSDDRYTSSIPLGFSFLFYGTYYDRIFLSENGFACFDSLNATNYTNYQIPSTSGPENLISLLWDDLSGVDAGQAYFYSNNADTFIVSFVNWDFETDHNQRIDMQFILSGSDNGIKYQYMEVGPVIYTSHTIGIENAGGDIGLQFVYNGTPLGNIAMPGLAISYVYTPPAIDAAMTSIDAPLGLVYGGDAVTPMVTVTNNSGNDQTIDVTFQIIDDGDNIVYNQTETTVSIPGLGGFVQHSFGTTWTAVDGDFTTLAYVTLAGDGNSYNDTLSSDFISGTHYSNDGPDEFGYRYIDNFRVGLEDPPTFNYIDLTASPTADTVGTSSGNYGNFPIGFDFSFYGQSYDSVYINGYGYLTFGGYTSTSTNDCPLPDPSTPSNPMIAGFWDLGYPSTSNEGATIIETFGTAPDRYMVVQFHNWRRSSTNLEWEIILHENGDIIMQYQNVDENALYCQGQSATIGLEDDSIMSGITYLCNDDFPGNRLTDGLAVKFYYQPYDHNIAVDHFQAPSGFVIIGDSFSPEVVFENKGLVNETNVPVRLTIEPGGYDDTQTIAIFDAATMETASFSMFTVPGAGTYTFTAISELSSDQNVSNDTLIIEVSAYDDVLDFEADNGELIATGDWQWGTPVNEGPPSAHSGVNCWGTIIDGNPNASTISDLDVLIDIPGADASFTFFQWHEGSTISYYFRVFVDDGSGFVLVEEWMGSNMNWLPYTVDLGAYTGEVTVRLEMEIGTYTLLSGWYVDDFAFTNCGLPGQCDYVVGDVNGSMTYNGLDITYGVSYFKGGTAPAFECECTPGNIWFVSGDVNGSCTYNGLDITYGVTYLKGGPGLVSCADCPPSSGLVPGGPSVRPTLIAPKAVKPSIKND